LLGGETATLHEGRVTQFDTTIDVHNQPSDLVTAQTFSDPPMNVIPMQKKGSKFVFTHGEVNCSEKLTNLTDGLVKIEAPVTTTEITGSETFVHVHKDDLKLVVLAHGVHRVNIGDTVSIYMDPAKFFIFDSKDELVSAPMAGAA